MFILKLFPVLIFTIMASSHPVVFSAAPRTLTSTQAGQPQVHDTQTPLGGPVNSTTTSVHTLHDLYQGNNKFRADLHQNARLQATILVDEGPSIVFLGCVDNRIRPSTIFNTPPGSIITHNNIANQYSSKDASADAAVAYAIESLHVKHIIVLGHYGCKGVETAIAAKKSKSSRLVRDWVRPITDLYSSSRRREIVVLRDSRKPKRGQDHGITTPPPASDPGFRALVEENVKRGVKELRRHGILAKAYAKRGATKDSQESTDVYVHGLVYDGDTGKVHNLRVSFGPPGKPIPEVPFHALAAAKNFHRASDRPHISKGKTWDFGSGI
jgi:carbonic anhydrase